MIDIYMYTNKLNNKKYVGQLINCVKRFDQHFKGNQLIDDTIQLEGAGNLGGYPNYPDEETILQALISLKEKVSLNFESVRNLGLTLNRKDCSIPISTMDLQQNRQWKISWELKNLGFYFIFFKTKTALYILLYIIIYYYIYYIFLYSNLNIWYCHPWQGDSINSDRVILSALIV